jgi:transcriptional regulator with XRE-family HTH domain
VASDEMADRGRQLADKLLAARTAAGLTQEALAQAAHLSRNHLQVLERGVGARANPRLSTLYALAAALGVRVVDLLPDDAAG